MDYKKYYSSSTLSMKSSMIRELVASTKGIEGLISFAGGFPSPKTFPKIELGDLYCEVVKKEGADVLQYGPTEGDPKFKEALVKYEKNVTLTTDEIITSVGSTNAIYAYSRCLINPGDAIICEAPSFLGTLVSFEAIGAELIGIEVEDDGINIEMLEAKIIENKAGKDNVKFIYVIPEFQNPSGVTMSLAKRKALIALSLKYDIPVLEDNPYGELRYSGTRIDSVFELARRDNHNNVTSVKSFSKVLGPGMRCAYIMGDANLMNQISMWLQKIIVSSDCVTQRVVSHVLNNNMLDKQLERISAIYKPNLTAMLDSLEKYMPKTIKWTKPEGGMFIWVTLPEGMSGDELFEKAKKEKIAFIPGSKFYPTGQEKYNAIRLNFTFTDTDTIVEGIKRLSKLF